VKPAVKPREWDYSPQPDGEPFKDREGNTILGWADRIEGQDPDALLAGFEAYEAEHGDAVSLTLRPILARFATDVECRINGWEEGTFVRCTSRAKNPQPMWQIEIEVSNV
jgi:hypothetical protein